MRIIPYLLGPGVRRFASALLFDPPLEIDVPAFVHEEAPRAFLAVVDKAARSGSPVAAAMTVAEKYLWLQQRHAETLKPEIDALRPHVRLVSALYPGTRKAFSSVRRIYAQHRSLVTELTNRSPAAAAAAFDFYWRIFEYWLELDRDPAQVVAVLEQEAEALDHPTELVIESYINRFLNTFGTELSAEQAEPSQGSTPKVMHSIVDSVGAADLGAACMVERNALFQNPPQEEVESEDAVRSITVAPVAFLIFHRLVSGHVPAIAGRAAAEQLAAMMEEHADALAALRTKCFSVAEEITTSAASLTEFNSRLSLSLSTLTAEAAAVRRQNRDTTRKYVEALTEDAVLWGIVASLAGLAVGVVPGVGALPITIGLFVRLGTNAVKARRERNEHVSDSDLRFLYYIDPDPPFA